MTVMTEGDADQRRETRWSANKKTDAVLRLFRGESLDGVQTAAAGGGAPAGRLA